MPPRSSSGRLTFSAAGFIAISTFGWPPGVRMSRDAKWIWNAETPARLPAGARISAGKSGSVTRSLPISAVASVKRLPASCMPSPESPAKRTTTRSFSFSGLVTWSCFETGLGAPSPVSERCCEYLGPIPKHVFVPDCRRPGRFFEESLSGWAEATQWHLARCRRGHQQRAGRSRHERPAEQRERAARCLLLPERDPQTGDHHHRYECGAEEIGQPAGCV